ncbi:sulfite exporter TauE/SafE family protein [bacterium]|nr:sulfite exporter TauE/SafE family protein [bacterium]
MTDTTIIIIGAIVIFLGALTQGTTGFGFGLISIPVLIMMLPPVMVIPILTLISLILTTIVLYETRKHIQIKRITPLIISGICGLPFGAYILKTIDPNILKIIIGFIIVAFSIAQIKGYKRTVKNEGLAFLPIGFTSGLLNTSTALSGPPVILFFINQDVKKEVFRANIITYFTVVNIFSIIVLLLNGVITESVIKYSLVFLPSVLMGVTAGIKLSKKVNENVFRKIALIIVSIAGLISIISGVKTGF